MSDHEGRPTTMREAREIKVGDERIAGGRITGVRTSASGKTVYITSERYGTERLGPTTRVAMFTGPAAPELTIYVATTGTGHYDWMGVGTTEDEARDALMSAWAHHCAQTGADLTYVDRADLNITSGRPGQGFCDGSPYPAGQARETEES